MSAGAEALFGFWPVLLAAMVCGAAPAPGSAEQPLPLAPVEVRAFRFPDSLARDRFDFRAGGLSGALDGLGEDDWAARGGTGLSLDSAATSDQNLFEGADLEVASEGPEWAFVEGGRVSLHDPIDDVSLGSQAAEYWTTSAGIRIHF